MNNKKLLGQKIKDFRKQNGLTQEKLAELIGIETGSLSAIESGRHFPSLLTLEKIAETLHIKLKALFEFDSLVSLEQMQKEITENLHKLDEKKIAFIYKFIDCYN